MSTTPQPNYSPYKGAPDSRELQRSDDSGTYRPAPRLWRSSTDRVFLGVLGGLAEKFGWETRPVRILVGLFGFLSIPALTLPVTLPYLALWAITRVRGPKGPPRQLLRSRTHSVVAGVLGGVARWIGMNPRLTRVIYCGLTVLTLLLPGIVTYLVLWAKLPVADPDYGLASPYDANITQP